MQNHPIDHTFATVPLPQYGLSLDNHLSSGVALSYQPTQQLPIQQHHIKQLAQHALPLPGLHLPDHQQQQAAISSSVPVFQHPAAAQPDKASLPLPAWQSVQHQNGSDTPPALPVSGQAAQDEPRPSRRHSEIKPKDSAGQVVWAKLARYPWWPAQVLAVNDSFIPPDSEAPRIGAVPVRFFGTYEFAWIESQRALATFDQQYEDKASKSKAKAFMDALQEAHYFLSTGVEPEGFNVVSVAEPPKAAKSKRAASAKGKGKKPVHEGAQLTPAATKAKSQKRKDEVISPEVTHCRSAKQRRNRILHHLGLIPPSGSPFAAVLCLDMIDKVKEAMRPLPVVQNVAPVRVEGKSVEVAHLHSASAPATQHHVKSLDVELHS